MGDVDFAVGDSQPVDASGPYAGVMRISFSGLLNALDGVVATEERMVFMTTNHFKRLPRALVRPGRVDLNVYVGLASHNQLNRMFLRFFPGEEKLAEQFAVMCADDGLSMAELQGFFMFFKDQPEAAAANVGQWLAARREVHEQEAGVRSDRPPSVHSVGADRVDEQPAEAAKPGESSSPSSSPGGAESA